MNTRNLCIDRRYLCTLRNWYPVEHNWFLFWSTLYFVSMELWNSYRIFPLLRHHHDYLTNATSKKDRGTEENFIISYKTSHGNKETRRVVENVLEKLWSHILHILFKITCAIWQLLSSWTIFTNKMLNSINSSC